ncbi:MAG: hypothetical protein K2X32_13855, partial [Phycisphaerales bacterium]|nr:hypothetical protein [Phycisphaerales bacterium]
LDAAKPLTVYQAVCQRARNVDQEGESGGEFLNYFLRLPEGFKANTTCNVVIILHPNGKDRQWVLDQHDPATFRTADILISLEGTTRADDGSRGFVSRQQDIIPMRDAILDVTRALPTKRVILVGFGESGLFALTFAAAFPRVIDGVVVHASGALDQTPTQGGIQGLPLVFVHSPADTSRPYAISTDARDSFANDGHPTVAVRRAPMMTRESSPEAISDAIDYVIGMTTPKPEDALDAARQLLRSRANRADRGGPAFGLARAILRRFEQPLEELKPMDPPPDAPEGAKMPAPFDPLRHFTSVDQKFKDQAFDLAVRIEEQAQRHLAALRASLRSPADLKLTGASDWIGHLVPFREDFRGVSSVEDFAFDIGLDETHAQQRDSADVISEAFAGEQPPEQAMRSAIEQLPSAFLVEGLPANMFERLHAWKNEPTVNNITPELLQRFRVIEDYERSIRNGREAYTALLLKFTPP